MGAPNFRLSKKAKEYVVIASQCSHWRGPFQGFPPVTIRSPKPSPERRRWLEEPDEVAVKFLGSPVPCMSLRTSPQTGVAIRPPRPPWLPLWGSCHEVTERVTTPSPPLRGTSPIGRGKPLIRLALAGNARATFTLWSNCHWQLLDFDSLRGAPPRRGRLGERIATSAYGLLAKTCVLRFCSENRTILSRYPIAHRVQTSRARIGRFPRQLRKKFTFIRFTPWEKCGTLTSNIVFYGGTP